MDEQGPLDFLSRHPLSLTSRENTERIKKCIIDAESTIV